MLFPAAKLLDIVVGVDEHTVIPPGSDKKKLTHPYAGPIYLWHTPKFPSANVFINGLPALGVGAMGYFAHIPKGEKTTNNDDYWKRYLTDTPMKFVLAALTLLANVAIAKISATFPKTKSAEDFNRDVTGIDTSTSQATWESIRSNLKSYSKWQTWVKLLMPPLEYPGDQGSTAIGSPNVTVNGAPLAFVAPLAATSCSERHYIPNAVTIGFSNVMVGVSAKSFATGLAANAARSGVSAAVNAGVEAIKTENASSC